MQPMLDDNDTVNSINPAAGRQDPAVQLTTAAFYIDADSQSPQCVKALTALVTGDLEMRIISATIAGNNNGKEIEAWRQELISEVPITAMAIPCHA
jgi:hypothetical protein